MHDPIDKLIKGLEKVVRERTGPGLIFVNRKRLARLLAEELSESLGYEVAWITADRPLKLRLSFAEQMRKGALRVAVCTSTWATGIDIPALQYVVLTGRDKAPILALQEVGRALRVAGEKQFEIVNLIEPGLESNGYERSRVLEEAGIEPVGPSMLDQLAEEGGGAAPQPTLLGAASFYGYWWYLGVVAAGGAVQGLLSVLFN